jgi:DNA repair protein RecO (recombination protein O)
MMLVKTKGILLHHIRYSDNSLIAHFYTEEYGRLSVMVKGLSSRKGGPRLSYFQPLNVFNIELYYYERKELQNLREMSLEHIPSKITGDISRSSIALFISEILYNVIREEDVNKMLYNFIESSVITLDELTEGISNFHLWFLAAFTAYAGIGPTPTTNENWYFDMLSGQFTEFMPLHPDYLEPHSAGVLNHLLSMSAKELSGLHLSGADRSDLLEKMIKYYNLHLPGIRQIHSLQIMREIFR